MVSFEDYSKSVCDEPEVISSNLVHLCGPNTVLASL